MRDIKKIHKNSRTPFKRKKNLPLSKEEKAENRELSRKHIKVFNISRKLKALRILREKYRNRRKKKKVQSYCRLLQYYNQIMLIGTYARDLIIKLSSFCCMTVPLRTVLS
jgi:hypothetical protein